MRAKPSQMTIPCDTHKCHPPHSVETRPLIKVLPVLSGLVGQTQRPGTSVLAGVVVLALLLGDRRSVRRDGRERTRPSPVRWSRNQTV